MAPEPVILKRRLNDEYPFAGPPASDGGLPYPRTACSCCDGSMDERAVVEDVNVPAALDTACP